MDANEKLIQYLSEAHATEQALVRTLQAHISMTPSGEYRRGLERHLTETRSHASRVQRRLGELGEGRGLVEVGVGVLQSLLGQALALTKGPLDLVRGSGGEEKLLKNAKDECATEALEIATYDALEHFARAIGDERTAELAASIRADEEAMLAELRAQLPTLVDAVARAELEGEDVYDVTQTGVAQAARRTARGARRTARGAAGGARQTASRGAKRARSGAGAGARQARRVPGVATAQGEVAGAVAAEGDLPIGGYDSLNADEVTVRLAGLSQVDLATVDAYERRHQGRSTVLERIDSLRGDEPWPGYDEQPVGDVRKAITAGGADRARQVLDYERRHKQRRGVIEAAERSGS